MVGILPDGFAGVTGKADALDAAHHGAGADVFRVPDHPAALRQRRRAAAARRRRSTRANAELAAIGGRFADAAGRRPDAQWGAVALSIGEARVEPAMRRSALAAAGGGRLRAPDRVRQRHGTVARARPHAPPRDRHPPRDRIEPAAAGPAAADRRAAGGRDRGRLRRRCWRPGASPSSRERHRRSSRRSATTTARSRRSPRRRSTRAC